MQTLPFSARIASILSAIQADLDAGMNVKQACRKAGYATTTYYHWKARHENPAPRDSARMSELEAEVRRLKFLVSELSLDRRILQEELRRCREARTD